jgi:hypothetical protein
VTDPKIVWPAAIIASLAFSSGCRSVLELQPEDTTTIRVGDVAAMRVDSDRHYSVGTAGDSLTLIKQTDGRGTTADMYRAIAVGRQTFVLTPRETGPDGCISCVTLHYFITVIP